MQLKLYTDVSNYVVEYKYDLWMRIKFDMCVILYALWLVFLAMSSSNKNVEKELKTYKLRNTFFINLTLWTA